MLRVGSAHRICSHILQSWMQKLRLLRARFSRAHIAAEASSWCRRERHGLPAAASRPRNRRRLSKKKKSSGINTVSINDDNLPARSRRSDSQVREKISTFLCGDEYDQTEDPSVGNGAMDLRSLLGCSSYGDVRSWDSPFGPYTASAAWISASDDGYGDVSLLRAQKHHSDSSPSAHGEDRDMIFESDTDTRRLSLSVCPSSSSPICRVSCNAIEPWASQKKILSRPDASRFRRDRRRQQLSYPNSDSDVGDFTLTSGGCCSSSPSLRNDFKSIVDWWMQQSDTEASAAAAGSRHSLRHQGSFRKAAAPHHVTAENNVKHPGVIIDQNVTGIDEGLDDASLCCDDRRQGASAGGRVVFPADSNGSPSALSPDSDGITVLLSRGRRYPRLPSSSASSERRQVTLCHSDARGILHMEPDGQVPGSHEATDEARSKAEVEHGDRVCYRWCAAASGEHDDGGYKCEHKKRRKKKVRKDADDGMRSVKEVERSSSSMWAIVKMSEKPEEDFRESIREMLTPLLKQQRMQKGKKKRQEVLNVMSAVEEEVVLLKQLLCWYLALNSEEHHDAIEEAFVDVVSEHLMRRI